MKESLLRRIARFSAAHYRWVFGCAAATVLSAVALFVFNPPQIQSDILDLLPRHSKAVEDFRLATEDFKSLDYLFVVLKTKDPKRFPVDTFEDFADEMAEGLKAGGLVEGVEYRLQDYQPLVEAMVPYTLLYLGPNDLGEVAKHFSDQGIRKQVQENKRMLANPASLLTKQLIHYDPFGLLPILKRHFMGRARQLKVDLSDGYYISKDGTQLIIIVRPIRPAQDIPFGKSLMAQVRKLESDARKAYAEDSPEAMAALEVKYGGGYPIAQDDANLIKRDAVINTFSSVILVMLVFWGAFRKRSALVYGWLPLVFGLLVTFALSHLAGVTINSATAGFGALLIGLGIDFSTVIYGRYIEERNKGLDVLDAIASVMGSTGRGVFIGAITTASTFGAMLVTKFEGMRQVGVFTSVGILVCAASVFVLMPAMLYYHHLHKTRRGIEPTFHMHGFGFGELALWSHRHPVAVLAGAGVLTAVFGTAALGIRLEDNIQNLRSPKNQGVEVTTQVANTFGASLTYMMAVVDGPSPEVIQEKSAKVVKSLLPFIDSGEVLFTDSIAAYLPPVEDQQKVLDALRRFPRGTFSGQRIRVSFFRSCISAGFNPDYFGSYLDKLEQMVAPAGPITFEDLQSSPLAPMLEKFIVKKGDGFYRGVVYIYVPQEYKRIAPEGLVGSIQRAVPGTRVTGVNILSRALRGQIKRDALTAFILGNILVFLLITLDFRSWKPAVMALVPLAVGLVWMLGTLRFMGEQLNMMNIFVTTLILGIGSDYGIYFVHRYLENDGRDMPRVIQETGVPIVIAALTTVAGFGSMSMSSYPGLRSMGYVSLLGTVYCMLATLMVLVAILTLRDRRANQKRGDGGEGRASEAGR